MREQLHELLIQASERVLGELAPDRVGLARDVPLTPARSAEHGDFASSAALMLAKPLGLPPRELAERLVAAFEDPDGLVARVEIAGPGFVNFFLATDRWHAVIERVLRERDGYGASANGGGESVQIEFVSANPTGPLTIGHGRNAVLGDCVASLLEATGHKVTREYYFNDGGRQMRLLADSLRARCEQALGRDVELPEEGYQGQYLVETARQLAGERGEELLDADWTEFRDAAQSAIFADIRTTLEGLGVHFDVYTNEQTLYTEGLVEGALGDLREAGLVYEGDGAVWLRTAGLASRLSLGAELERDRVLVRSSGEPTYLLPDIAYHREKCRRGFQRMICVLGPDHVEQFPYVRAAVGALGFDPKRLEALYYQWVNLRRGGELVKMSTRKASFVTVDDVLAEVGRDAFRFFMVDRRADTHLDFDLDLARDRSDRNPVYKIQYAHARLCSIERQAAERGVLLDPLDRPETLPLERLELAPEHELCKRVGRLPEVVMQAAQRLEPQEVARYLLDLAGAFNAYVADGKRHRVLGDDERLTLARLGLVRAVRTALCNGLGLLGIEAPERM